MVLKFTIKKKCSIINRLTSLLSIASVSKTLNMAACENSDPSLFSVYFRFSFLFAFSFLLFAFSLLFVFEPSGPPYITISAPGRGLLPRILDRGVPRRFVNPNPI